MIGREIGDCEGPFLHESYSETIAENQLCSRRGSRRKPERADLFFDREKNRKMAPLSQPRIGLGYCGNDPSSLFFKIREKVEKFLRLAAFAEEEHDILRVQATDI